MSAPYAAERVDGGERCETQRSAVLLHGVEDGEPIAPHGHGVRGPFRLRPWKPGVLDATAVSVVPLGLRKHPDPVGGLGGEHVQGGSDRLGGQFQPVELADVGGDVGRVCPLSAPTRQEATVSAGIEDAVEEHVLGAAMDEPCPELAEHTRVETGVVEREPEEALPVDPAADGVGGGPVGEPLAELEDGHEGEPPRRVGRLAEGGVEHGEIAVGEHGPELVAEGEQRRALGEGGVGDPGRVDRDRTGLLGLEHGGVGGRQLVPRAAQEVPNRLRQQYPLVCERANRSPMLADLTALLQDLQRPARYPSARLSPQPAVYPCGLRASPACYIYYLHKYMNQ